MSTVSICVFYLIHRTVKKHVCLSLYNFIIINFHDIKGMHFIGGKNDIFMEFSDKFGQWQFSEMPTSFFLMLV